MLELYNNAKKEIVFKESKIEPLKYLDKAKLTDSQRNKFDELGKEVIKKGQYAVVTMAGGQGTRLGHPGPKGTFKLDVYGKGKYLFEILVDNLKEAKQKYGVTNISQLKEIKDKKKQTKKKKKMSLILNLSLLFVILPALVVMILSTIKVGEKAIISFSWVPITTISIALAFVIALLVVKHIFDKKHQKITHDYFYFYLNAVSAYSLKDMNITDGKIAAEGTMKDDLLIQAHYFAQIFSISSRGLVVGKKDGKDFTYGEIACAIPYKTKEQAYAIPSPIYDLADGSELPYIPAASDETTGNKKKNVFDNQTQSYGMLGRMLCLNNKVTPDESFIIALRGKMNDTVMPDYIKNYKPYQDKRLGDKIIIYLATDEGKKFFNDENIDLLSKFIIDDVVTSGFVTVNSYGSKIALNLSDSLMVLPIENKVNVSSLDSLRVSLNTLVKFVENCIKDSSYEDKDEKEDNQAEENKVEEKKEEENKLEDEVPSKE